MSREQPIDQIMEEAPEAVEPDVEVDMEKIKMLPGASEDGSAASFQIAEEDHTVGNSLRYIIMKKYVTFTLFMLSLSLLT